MTELKLGIGESIRVMTGSLVAFETTVAYRIETAATFFDAFFGHEGLFFTSLTGPGSVWLQSLPRDQLVSSIYDRTPKCPSHQKEEDAKKGKQKAIKAVVGGAALFGFLDDDDHGRFG